MRPRRAADALGRELPDGEQVIVGPGGQVAIVLNAVGSVVWELCDGERDVEAIAALLAQTLTGAPEHGVLADVRRLVDQLLEADLLEDACACGAPSSKP